MWALLPLLAPRSGTKMPNKITILSLLSVYTKWLMTILWWWFTGKLYFADDLVLLNPTITDSYTICKNVTFWFWRAANAKHWWSYVTCINAMNKQYTTKKIGKYCTPLGQKVGFKELLVLPVLSHGLNHSLSYKWIIIR